MTTYNPDGMLKSDMDDYRVNDIVLIERMMLKGFTFYPDENFFIHWKHKPTGQVSGKGFGGLLLAVCDAREALPKGGPNHPNTIDFSNAGKTYKA
jgi:hypothetical protein